MIGSSLAWIEGSSVHWLALFIALCRATLTQIATNRHNDAVDCEKGNDLPDRPSLLRVTADGGCSYSSGRRPIPNAPFGELFVLLFFGRQAVGGSVWLQGDAPDINHPARRSHLRPAGRHTLAALLSRAGGTRAYTAMLLTPFLRFSLLARFGHRGVLLGLFALLNGLAKVRTFTAPSSNPALNLLLPATARCSLILAVPLTAGLLVELA